MNNTTPFPAVQILPMAENQGPGMEKGGFDLSITLPLSSYTVPFLLTRLFLVLPKSRHRNYNLKKGKEHHSWGSLGC